MFTQEKIDAELKRIQSSVPKLLMDNVVKNKDASPTVKFIVEKALEDDDFPEEKKKELRLLQNTGFLDKKIPVQNDRIAKQIDNFISREITKSVNAGRLPNKKQLQELNLKTPYGNQNKK